MRVLCLRIVLFEPHKYKFWHVFDAFPLLPQVIEHVDDPKSFVQACAGCVEGRDGAAGSLFISTMNRTRKAQLMAVVGAEYVLGLLPPGKLQCTFMGVLICLI